MNAAAQRSAVQAWLAWRAARHVAVGGAGRDPLRTLLASFMQERGLPTLARQSPAQLDEVLDKITEIEWNQRPF